MTAQGACGANPMAPASLLRGVAMPIASVHASVATFATVQTAVPSRWIVGNLVSAAALMKKLSDLIASHAMQGVHQSH